jgi:hypothetical protein
VIPASLNVVPQRLIFCQEILRIVKRMDDIKPSPRTSESPTTSKMPNLDSTAAKSTCLASLPRPRTCQAPSSLQTKPSRIRHSSTKAGPYLSALCKCRPTDFSPSFFAGPKLRPSLQNANSQLLKLHDIIHDFVSPNISILITLRHSGSTPS